MILRYVHKLWHLCLWKVPVPLLLNVLQSKWFPSDKRNVIELMLCDFWGICFRYLLHLFSLPPSPAFLLKACSEGSHPPKGNSSNQWRGQSMKRWGPLLIKSIDLEGMWLKVDPPSLIEPSENYKLLFSNLDSNLRREH